MYYLEIRSRLLFSVKIMFLLLSTSLLSGCLEDDPCLTDWLAGTGLEEFRAFNIDENGDQIFYQLCGPIGGKKNDQYRMEYVLTVPYATERISVAVIPLISDFLAELYSDKVLLDGNTFSDIPLRPGDNDLTVYLTNYNNTSLYNLRVKREYAEESPAAVADIMDDAFNRVCDTSTRLLVGVNGAASTNINENITWIGAAGLNSDAYGSESNFLPTNYDEKRSIMTTDHVAGTGSITKTFFAALALKMIEDGYTDLQGNDLTLGTTLVSGLQLTKSDGYYRGRSYIEQDEELEINPLIGDIEMSLKDLLSHRSSLIDPGSLSQLTLTDTSTWETFLSIFKPVRKLIKDYSVTNSAIKLDEEGNPHPYLYYANINYQLVGIILAEILAQKDGETVSHALNRYFFKPFNLSSTYFNQNNPYPGNDLVRGHILGSRIIYFLDNDVVQVPNFAASLVSSPEDLVRWAEALWGRTGVAETGEDWEKLVVTERSEVLSIESLSNMLEDIQGEYDNADSPHYGLGVMLGELDDPYLGHYGTSIISNAALQYDRVKGNAVAVQVNNVLNFSTLKSIAVDILCSLDKDCVPATCEP